mgnify:CR=1 FL=1
MKRVDAGVSSAGLMMQVFPHAIAGAILQVAIISGKFHGEIAETTPAGGGAALPAPPVSIFPPSAGNASRFLRAAASRAVCR